MTTKTVQTTYLIVLALAIFSLERVIFYLLNLDYFSILSPDIIFLGFFKGFRIDIITIFTFTFPFILALLYLNSFRKSVGYLFLAVVIFIFTINLGDIAYFPFVHRHLSNEIFLLANDLDFFIDFSKNYIFEISIYFVSIFLFFTIWKKILNQKVSSEKYPLSQKTLFTLTVLVIIVLGIRGKTSGKPFALSDAFVNDNIASANLSLNGFYSIYRGKSRKEYKFMESEKALKTTINIFQNQETEFTSSDFPIERKMLKKGDKKDFNIVLLTVESLTSKYVDSFGNENFGATPYLDRLAKESISFPNFYANGQRSIEGIGTILSGVPSISGLPNFGYGLELSNFSYLGKILKENGYKTIGMQGSKRSSFRIDNVLSIAGFDEVYGAEDMKDFLKDEKDIDLPFGAVWDGNLLRFMKSRIDNAEQPFISFGFTATTHFPCKLPNKKYEIYPHVETSIDGYLNNLKYLDSQIEEFIESSKKESWFKNTIFIITADHTIGKGIGIAKDRLNHFRIPLIIYAPHIFKPQIIERVGTQADIFPTIIDILNLENSFSTLSNSLFDNRSERFGILREGNRMLLLDENGTYKSLEKSETLQAILQTVANLIRQNKISEN